MSSPALLIRLASQNLADGDAEAALVCLEQALAREPTAAQRAEVGALAQQLIEADGPWAEKARWVAARAHGSEVGATPRRAEPGFPSPTSGSQTLDAIHALLSSQGGGAEPALPAADVIARLLGADLDLTTTANLALEFVAQATAAARAHLLLAGETQAAYGLGEGAPRPPETSRGVIDEVLRSRRAVRVDDALADPRFGERESVRELGLGAVLCVPVLADDDLVGAIYLEAAQGRTFRASDQSLVETLAGLVGPTLRAGRRYQAQGQALERARRSASRARRRALRSEGGPVLVGRSPALRALQASIDRYAPGRHPVLIQGESGSGKELVARALHAGSDRAERPFEAENMAALAPSLVEATLYGHEKGAFTGADEARPGLFRLAHGGTLLLDEIGDLDLAVQAKLLRVLEEGEVRPVGGSQVETVDVRILAATHRDLLAEVRAGRFREDLYYRLSVIKLAVPPLRDRPEDIPALLEHFLTEHAAEQNLSLPQLPMELLQRLRAYGWPGNVRQLKNYAVRLLLAGPLAPLPEGPKRTTPAQGERLAVEVALDGDEPYPLREARKVFDKAFLELVLARGERLGEVAAGLGIHRSYLSQLMKAHGLQRRRGAPGGPEGQGQRS
jgi:transcriptional regulator with GAF, ATPase, and Fis domain